MGRQRSSRSVIPNRPVRRNGWPKVVAGQGRSPPFRGGPVFSEPVHTRANLFRWRRYQTRSGVMHWKRKTKTAKWSYRTSELVFTGKSHRGDCSARDIGILSPLRIVKLSLVLGQNCQSDKQRANKSAAMYAAMGPCWPGVRVDACSGHGRGRNSALFGNARPAAVRFHRKNAPYDNCSIFRSD